MASIGQDLLDVPFAQMVESMASGIAEAQFKLDMYSLRIAQLMAGQQYDPDKGTTADAEDLKIQFGKGAKLSLLELGFTPTFYQFVDTIIEVKMSISMSTSTESAGASVTATRDTQVSGLASWFRSNGTVGTKTATVSASYASKYQYSAEGASLLRTKLVPVPPPAILEERIRAMING